MKVRARSAEELARRSAPLTADQLAEMERQRKTLLEQACDELTLDHTRAMVSDMVLQQLQCRMDQSRWVSICGARRASKTTYISMDTLIEGEERPGHVTMIGAPQKEWLEQNYWGKAESGILGVAQRYGIQLETKVNALTWEHKNGSRGILMGMKGQREVEGWFGAEANRYALDEMHRQPTHLYRLALDKSIGPQAISRKAKVIVAGNPGDVCTGDFHKATDPEAEDSTATPYDQMHLVPEEDRGVRWSFHHMTQQGNTAMPHQWEESLALKRRNKWDDDHPTWMQQCLGLWVPNQDALRFKYDREASATLPLPANGLYTLGVWMTPDATYLMLLSYDVDTGAMGMEWEGTCSGDPGEVVRTCRQAEKRAGGSLAWMGLGSEKRVSDVLYDWYVQQGLVFERFRKSEKASYLALANGALTSGRLGVPSTSTLSTQLSEAPKEEAPGHEYTDALLVAVGQLPAPPMPAEVRDVEEKPRSPWDAAFLPVAGYGVSNSSETKKAPGQWQSFMKAHDWKGTK